MRAWLFALVLLMPITEFEQSWPVLKTNSGISAAGNVDFVPHGATARDADYPNIGLTDEIKVVNNGSDNVLDANTTWASAGVVADRNLGAVVGSGSYPTYINADRRLFYYADYHITAASLAGNTFAVLLSLNATAGGNRMIALYLKPDGSDWAAEISTELWNEADISDDSTIIATADLEDKRVRFLLDLTPGTMDPTGSTVQDDGSLTVSMIDLDTDAETTLYTFTNRSFYLSWINRDLGGGSLVPANNALAVMQVGYAGLIGENERFGIYSVGGVAPDPDPGELMGPTPEPTCCGGENATGPILPPTETTWTANCDGGGTVPTAADLTDSENWDD